MDLEKRMQSANGKDVIAKEEELKVEKAYCIRRKKT